MLAKAKRILTLLVCSGNAAMRVVRDLAKDADNDLVVRDEFILVWTTLGMLIREDCDSREQLWYCSPLSGYSILEQLESAGYHDLADTTTSSDFCYGQCHETNPVIIL